MSQLLEMVSQQLGGQNLTTLSRQIGADEQSTQNAISMALPLLLGGLAKNSAQPQGAAALDRALTNHDGGLLDNLGAMLGSGALGTAGAGILGHILGQRRAPVEQGISKASGLQPQQVGRLLMLLAPIVMAALSRMKQQNNVSGTELGDVLQREKADVATKSPGAGGLLGMLDSDNDGSIADDLARMAPGMLGGLFGGRK
jgi:hypothetical protein